MYEKVLRPLPAPSSMERPADAIVEQQYKKVLEALLLPPAAAAKLIETEPIEKKWQTITMNMGLLSDKRAKADEGAKK